jgi:hypothetical protein
MGEVTNNQIMSFINEQLLIIEGTEAILDSSEKDLLSKSFEKAMLIGQMAVVNDLAKFIMEIIHDHEN